MKKNNMATKYILLALKVLLYQQTNGLLFDFNFQYVTFKLWAQFLFASALKME